MSGVGQLEAVQEVLRGVAQGLRLPELAELVGHRAGEEAPGVTFALFATGLEGTLQTIVDLSGGAFSPTEADLARQLLGHSGAGGAQAAKARFICTDANCADARKAHKGCTCWSAAIVDRDSQLLGALVFRLPSARLPSAAELHVAERSHDLCRLVIEHEMILLRLERVNQHLDAVLSNVSQGLCLFDAERTLIIANSRYSELYGLPPEAVRPGITLQRVIDLRVAHGSGPAMEGEHYLNWRSTIQAVDQPTDTVVELANGNMIAIHHRPMPGGGWVSTHEDVTERHRAEAQIVFLATHDALTALPNRLRLQARLEEFVAAAKRGQRFALLYLDLDRFKAVNDTFGHPAGDELLIRVARRLEATVREVDLVSRLGGDEFAVLLSGIERLETGSLLARRIVKTLSEPYHIEGHKIEIGVSVGIAIAPDHGITADLLLKNADAAQYHAKHNGLDFWVHEC